jgi:acetyltransferase-like isoleucine patch superfamily enzyme
MILLKVKYAFSTVFTKIFYKLIYGKKIVLGKKIKFRSVPRIIIGKQGKLIIGDGVFFNVGCSIACLNQVNIGDLVLFGENVKIYDHNHKFNNSQKPIISQGFSIGWVIVESNCWIGSNVILTKGAHIFSKSVVGAGCTVNFVVESGYVVKNSNSIVKEKIDYLDS